MTHFGHAGDRRGTTLKRHRHLNHLPGPHGDREHPYRLVAHLLHQHCILPGHQAGHAVATIELTLGHSGLDATPAQGDRGIGHGNTAVVHNATLDDSECGRLGREVCTTRRAPQDQRQCREAAGKWNAIRSHEIPGGGELEVQTIMECRRGATNSWP